MPASARNRTPSRTGAPGRRRRECARQDRRGSRKRASVSFRTWATPLAWRAIIVEKWASCQDRLRAGNVSDGLAETVANASGSWPVLLLRIQQAVQLVEGADQVFLIVVGQVAEPFDDPAHALALVIDEGLLAVAGEFHVDLADR